MSSDALAIKVEGLSKCYQIYENPQDRLKEAVCGPLRRVLGLPEHKYHRDFWALRDVSFDVRKGETVGIIGHNGSGKSTLLQMIAGTLAQTTGRVEVHGRVAALLELGSGFNPEFTGRENVKMYGQLLGMTPDEVDARYDEIVEFSEIKDFIDQPLKTYSSGMGMRLAFSVVAHVDPEILIVDEALSVGDVFFQAKCMALLRKRMDSGMTLLFVSHDSGSVKSLCSRAVLLDHGNMLEVGESDAVVERYYSTFVGRRQRVVGRSDPTASSVDDAFKSIVSSSEKAALPVVPAAGDVSALREYDSAEFLECAKFQRIQNGKAEFVNVLLLDAEGNRIREVDFEERITLRMILLAHEDIPVLAYGYHLRDRNGFDLAYSDSGIEDQHLYDVKAGHVYVVDWIMPLAFKEGDYTISAVTAVPLDLTVGSVETCDHVPIALQFRMNRGRLPLYGAMRLDAALQVRNCSEA
ncbi:sugar ABC transporter ATP-binding protein [Zoogloea ramigera]|uniref:Sugar ABC transporter ATP-binding protein n=1 Tax=Zoogloea ramigera TaxID=350 RepID=A0A4Y4CQR2_ZOORA|nr:ABC transporter ATP-binding protein [Zoogloea ramigera]GEC94382.1 sugar ABC transporter ATP-binding protein [Zoogloea ramigera]